MRRSLSPFPPIDVLGAEVSHFANAQPVRIGQLKKDLVTPTYGGRIAQVVKQAPQISDRKHAREALVEFGAGYGPGGIRSDSPFL